MYLYDFHVVYFLLESITVNSYGKDALTSLYFSSQKFEPNCFNHLGANMLLVNRFWHPLPLAFYYHFKLDCLNKKTKINCQNEIKKQQQQHKVNNNKK